MNYKLLWGVVFLSLPFLSAQDIDHAAISAHAQSMKKSHLKKQRIYEAAFKVGGAVLCASVVYYLYTLYAYNNLTVPLAVSAEVAQELKKPSVVAELIKKGAQKVDEEAHDWTNSIFGNAVKLTGSLVFQSIVFQALQPFYSEIKSYFSAHVSVPVTRSWFLLEQYQGPSDEAQNKKVEITRDLFDCIMHIESVEAAYSTSDVDLLKDSAQVILTHILFVKENNTHYIYERHVLQKIYDTLTSCIQEMLLDAKNSTYDATKLRDYKEALRDLRKLSAYCIF